MKNFITNSGADSLKKRISELIEHSDELKFLVGFFYFSGIKEFYQSLKKNPGAKLKILIGLDVDKTNKGVFEIAFDESELSDEERSYRFIESVKKSINTDYFDTEEFYEQVKFFIELIRQDRILIRKTYRPNHSKLYIFKLKQIQIARDKLFITGSSNLTKAGLTTQDEFNVEISDYGVNEAEEYFDKLWEEAVKITEIEDTKKRLVEIIEKDTLVKDITPFEAFVFILKNYLDSYEHRDISSGLIVLLENLKYKRWQYQLDAVKQALAYIEKNNGVIIADVVGLGKTIIACAVARELRKRGIIICPPGIIGDKNKKSGWRKYAEQFQLHDWEVRSSGDLENTLELTKTVKDFEVIIIDEAHRFRNQDTQDYEFLRNICRNKIVILLTATPFNNKPGDILSLLKLFIIPKKSAITLENNLVDMFRYFKSVYDKLGYIMKYHNSKNEKNREKAKTYYQMLFGDKNINLTNVKNRAKYLSNQIRDVIEPVIIRRNRLDLLNNPYYKEEVKELSKVENPQEWFFELSKEQSEFYDKIIIQYFADPEEGGQFKGAIYQPFAYEKKLESEDKELTMDESFELMQQRNLYDFMRRMLVKRFESSFGSFKQSIENFKSLTLKILDFIDKTNKYILDRKLLLKIYDENIEVIEEELLKYEESLKSGNFPKNNKIYEIENFVLKDKFLEDIKSDLKLYDDILIELDKLDLVNNDPKSKCMIEHILSETAKGTSNNEPKRKYVIFSEYVDTIKHLKPVFEKEFKNRCLIIPGKLSAKTINEINENFDAVYEEQKNDFDILLTSDILSEGFNLNRAGMVINYDIPWNPVRVIQRVGRINRISKKVFDSLYIVNFFPTERGSDLVKSRQIAQQKMFLIHNTLGEDVKIFDIDEEPSPAKLYQRLQQNPEEGETESIYTKLLKEYLEIKEKEPGLIKNLINFPSRIKVAKKYSENELLVFFKKGRIYINGMKYDDDNSNDIQTLTIEEAYERIKCTYEEKAVIKSEKFWNNYYLMKKYKGKLITKTPEKSLENQALLNINSITQTPWQSIMHYLDFIRTLRNDIIDYGTLSDFTHRRISGWKYGNEKEKEATTEEIKQLMSELGENYLIKEIEKQKEILKEVIIAVENQNLSSL